MEKPLNKVALFVWVIAGLAAVSQVIAEPILHQMTMNVSPELANATARVALVYWHLSSIRSGVVISTMLVAAGAIIEILDQISWHLARRDHREEGKL